MYGIYCGSLAIYLIEEKRLRRYMYFQVDERLSERMGRPGDCWRPSELEKLAPYFNILLRSEMRIEIRGKFLRGLASKN